MDVSTSRAISRGGPRAPSSTYSVNARKRLSLPPLPGVLFGARVNGDRHGGQEGEEPPAATTMPRPSEAECKLGLTTTAPTTTTTDIGVRYPLSAVRARAELCSARVAPRNQSDERGGRKGIVWT